MAKLKQSYIVPKVQNESEALSKCVRLNRLQVGFRMHIKSLHFHFIISFHFISYLR